MTWLGEPPPTGPPGGPPPPPEPPAPGPTADAITVTPPRARLVPRRPDMALGVAAVPTVFWWSTGPGWIEVLAVVVAWTALTSWWLVDRGPHSVWGPLVCITVLWVANTAMFHPAFRLEQDCFQAKADAGFAFEIEGAESRTLEVGGACGIVDFTYSEVIEPFVQPPVEPYRVVAFYGAGPPSMNPLAGVGYVFSPDHEPASCVEAYGWRDFNSCAIDDLGDGWYRVESTTSFN